MEVDERVSVPSEDSSVSSQVRAERKEDDENPSEKKKKRFPTFRIRDSRFWETISPDDPKEEEEE